MSIEDLKSSVQNWKEIVDANAFADSISALVESTISASPIVDKTSTWAAAGAATIAGIAVTNVDKMATAYSLNEIKLLFSFLAASIFFALIQKYLATSCATSLKVSEEIKSRLSPVLSVYDESETKIEEMSKKHNLGIKADYDFTKVLETYISLYPKWSLFFLKSKFEKSITDRNYVHKTTIKNFIIQCSCAFIQYLAMLGFVCFAAIFI